MRTLITNSTYLSSDYSWINGNILIEDGIIKKIGTENFEHDIKINAENHLILPGLINSHSHSYTSFSKASIENTPLDIYMLHAFASSSERNYREIYISTLIEGIELLKNGVTSTLDHFMMRPNISVEGLEVAAKAYKDCGIKANIAPQYSDLSYSKTVPFLSSELPKKYYENPISLEHDQYFSIMDTMIKNYQNNDQVKFLIGVDGPQRCSDELIKKTAKFLKNRNCGWHTHILESKTQAITSYQRYGKGLVEYLNDFEVLNNKTTFVHYVWSNLTEDALVKENNVNIVHCPSSLLHLGSGMAKIDKFYHEGMNIAIGTDGANSGNLNMIEKIRLTADLHNLRNPDYNNWITAKNALKMCYENGRKVMMNDNIGRIAIGCDADLVFIDTNNSLWQPIHDLTKQFVYTESGVNIKRVMVKGEILVENGELTRLNELSILKEATDLKKEIDLLLVEKKSFLMEKLPYYEKMYFREIMRDIGKL